MVRLVRGVVIAFLAVLVAAFGAGPSSAADNPSEDPTISSFGCLNPVDAYGAPQVCQLGVHTLSPVCDNDVPYLSYDIQAVGSPNTTATITWLNPSGANVVYANQPLSGRVLWPGAVPGPDGKGIDWPGWRQLADGSWVEGDEFDWVRPSVVVNFKVNPEDTVTVAYPPSSPSCNTNPPGEEVLDDPGTTLTSNPTTAVLSATGSDAGPLAALGAGLVVIGALAVALVAIARRRRATS